MRHWWKVLIGVGAVAVGLFLWSVMMDPSFASFVQPFRQHPQVQLVVIGDTMGDQPVYQAMIDEVKDQPYDALLNLGDFTELGTKPEFEAVHRLESAVPFPVYHTLGNHDIKSSTSYEDFETVFRQPPWTSVDIGPLHLVILDNADRKVGFPAASLDWLEQDLAKHADQQIIIAYHRSFHLPFESFVGDDETRASRLTNDRMVAIAKQFGVDQILTGHVHTYLPYQIEEIPAAVSGGGGDTAQALLGGSDNNFFHYLLVTVTADRISIEVKPIDPTE